jgi:hypothetical protein
MRVHAQHAADMHAVGFAAIASIAALQDAALTPLPQPKRKWTFSTCHGASHGLRVARVT